LFFIFSSLLNIIFVTLSYHLFLFFLCKKIWINVSHSFFTNDSICNSNLHLADDHLRMPRVGDLDEDVNKKQNNLFFFTNHLFFSSQMWHLSFSKFVNRIFSLWFLMQSFLHARQERGSLLWKDDYYGILSFRNLDLQW